MLRFIKNFVRNTVRSTPSEQDSPATIIPRSEHCVSRADISPNALKVLKRLQKSGFEAYLVGGSVRDLLLRHAPKDFDVVTDALPNQIRKLFRNCRLIGRRFRLAHILFGREIIEVATFRAGESPKLIKQRKTKSGMLLHDNVYGDIQSDAFRRDFTVNALFYNIADFSLVDYTGGDQDIELRLIRLIGDPVTRYQEDPVRMLRAVRFAAKLDFTIHPDTEAPIYTMGEHLHHIAPARLFEEMIKLFHGGYALQSFYLLEKYRLFKILFPFADKVLNQNPPETMRSLIESTLKNTDARVKDDKPVTPAFLLATFLWHPLLREQESLIKEGLSPASALEQAMAHILQQQVRIISIPKRLSRVVREMWLMQFRFPRRTGSRPYRLLHHPRFRAGYDFLLLRCETGEEDTQLGEWWTEFQTADVAQQEDMISEQQKHHWKKGEQEEDKR